AARLGLRAILALKGDKPAQIKARFVFYDGLAGRIEIPGIVVERNRDFDGPKAQNGGISLKYESLFQASPELKKEVLLEAGFEKTAPNEPRDFSSWASERARDAKRDVVDNRALGVKCFNPEYTFVDKLQTICRRFRQHRDRNDAQRDRPRHFLRHYYDLYMLLDVERVKAFIGTDDYETYKKQKLKTTDAKEFASREAFLLEDPKRSALFEEEFEVMSFMLTPPRPSFADVLGLIREHAAAF
ncbi:MAG: nucleotidyl transferase AbiEii/AbiGii toxin family protein, partial [Elusimicrobiota bacterium]